MKLEDVLKGSYTSEKSKVYKKALRKFKKNRLLKYRKKKKKKICESITRDEAVDAVEEVFISLSGEVPDGPGYEEAVKLVMRKSNKENAEAIAYSVIQTDIEERDLWWSYNEPLDIEQSKERTKEIKDAAKKLKPVKQLKLK